MAILNQPREFLRVLGEFARTIPSLGFKMAQDSDKTSLGAIFETTANRFPDRVMLVFEDRQWTYREFNHEVNQMARYLLLRGVKRGDTVALVMDSRPEFLLCLFAIVKTGAAASLINNSLTGDPLVHCINSTKATRCIVGHECAGAVAGVLDKLSLQMGEDYLWFPDGADDELPHWALDARSGMQGMSGDNLQVTAEITAGELALYVFTSGTTGMPKAAVLRHRKILAAGMGVGKIGFRIRPADRLYLCLPLYHLTGLGAGLTGFLAIGASVYLRRGFSASSFWKEIQESQSNCFIYVGELCRFLALQPASPYEKNNPLEKMMGNGLRPDVWDQFRTRFSVGRICEIYGSSEGNVTFLNFLNKEKTIGAAISKIALVRYDTDNDEILRDQDGRCIEVARGEPGLLLGEISDKAKFDGYTNPEETESKIIGQVCENGDRWFNTGDLVREIDVGFAMGLKHFQFVDRTGDTFRWRAENVSTNEVAEALNQHPQISMANVYGVEIEGAEGRAGMVAFELPEGQSLDLNSFETLVDEQLPEYARPVFIRILQSAETTMTFKLLKGDLRKQGFDPMQLGGDLIYVRKPRSRSYELLDEDYYETLSRGEAGF
jgi:citronellyl-CoA synthetase